MQTQRSDFIIISMISVISVLCTISFTGVQAAAPIRIGLNADMSTADVESGEAIRRGALIAIEEINAAGGVLGRPLALEVRDHRRNPARGLVNVRELAEQPDVVAILGGKHTPVILGELALIHEIGIPYLVAWAAGTPIVDNGFVPNFVFRVSVRDEFAGEFLVAQAVARGYSRLALVLEQTGWGRSNEQALMAALRARGLKPVQVEWFNWGEKAFDQILSRSGQADALMFVGNAPDGVNLVRALAAMDDPEALPMIAHWGIAGGDFVAPLGEMLEKVDLMFLQTFSFFTPPFPERAAPVIQAYTRLFDTTGTLHEIEAPTGVAHAYDLVHLLGQAIERAGNTRRAAVREAIENLEYHAGLVRDYAPPFTPHRHDALTPQDYRMARFVNGAIIPLKGMQP